MTAPSMTSLLERYEKMHVLSCQMLGAAEKNEWDQLISLSETRMEVSTELEHADVITWHGQQAVRKAHLITSIMEVDAEIKTRTQTWMNELKGMLGSINTEKKLKKAYE